MGYQGGKHGLKWWQLAFALIAIFMIAIPIFGGFVVTMQEIQRQYQRDQEKHGR